MRGRGGLVVAVAALVVGIVVVGAGAWVATRGDEDPLAARTGGPGPTSPARSTAAPAPSPTCGAWGCEQSARFAAATSLIRTVPGHLGIVVRDRVTGAVWSGGEPDYRIWAGSTPKLAFTVALLEQDRAGQITLDSRARSQIAAMLSVSDNTAADSLWNRYASATTMMTRFRQRYAMSTAGYVNGFPSRWGFVKCTPKDLANLMTYILTTLDAADRDYIVHAMRTVGEVQHWGVWGAGAALRPGVKDGWSVESDAGRDHWITATVGFAGPDERYVVAAMYHQLPGGDSIGRGVHTLTDLVATVFGAPVPAPVVIPPDY